MSLVIRLAYLILINAYGDLTRTRLLIAVELMQESMNVAVRVMHPLNPSMVEPS